MGSSDDAIEKFRARQQGIDVDQWIEDPKQVAEYVKARLKQPANLHPLDLLYRDDILTARHIGAGWFLIRLRARDLLRLEVAQRGDVVFDKIRGPARPTDAETLDGDWIFILDHLLAPWQKNFVQRICWQYDHRSITAAWVYESRTAIAESFDALIVAMEKIYPPKKTS